MVKVGIVGASGYSGIELVKLLLKHPEVSLEFISGTSRVEGRSVVDLYPALRKTTNLEFILTDLEEIIRSDVDCVFLATPNETSLEMVPRIINESNKKIVDLSGSFRLKDNSLYTNYYGFENNNIDQINNAVYGIPELYKDKIRKTRLVANPGCYPTSVILALAPLLKANLVNLSQKIIVDAKSGVSGAGRKPTDNTHYVETNENLKAYNVQKHRHEPEIAQELCNAAQKPVNVTFTPHLIPVNRGILSTIYLEVNDNVSINDILSLWNEFYTYEQFVRILPEGVLPEIKNVAFTPYCDLGASMRNTELIVVSCIDNLLKGASSQALQNFNLMYGFKETLGL